MSPVVETKRIPLDSLHFYPGNARLHDDELIADSLRKHGQYRALVVQKSTMYVLAGNGTLHGLYEIKAKDALCHIVDVDDTEAAKIVLVDNRANDRAKYDNGLLADLLQALPDLEGTGYDDAALSKLLGDDGDTSSQLEGLDYRVIVECASESEQRSLIERFEAEGLKVKALIS